MNGCMSSFLFYEGYGKYKIKIMYGPLQMVRFLGKLMFTGFSVLFCQFILFHISCIIVFRFLIIVLGRHSQYSFHIMILTSVIIMEGSNV